MEKVPSRDKITTVSDDYRSELLSDLRDPSYASGYLKAILNEGDRESIMIALTDIADAYQIRANDTQATLNADHVHSLASNIREHLAKMDEMTQQLERMQPSTPQTTQALRPPQA